MSAAATTAQPRPKRIHRDNHAENFREHGIAYESIRRDVLFNGDIEARAKARLMIMLALPPDFDIHRRGVRNYHDGKMRTTLFPSTTRGNGMKAILNDLKHLRSFGHAQHFTLHCSKTGRVIRGVWSIFETPKDNCCDMTQLVDLDADGKIIAYHPAVLRGSKGVTIAHPQPAAAAMGTITTTATIELKDLCLQFQADEEQKLRVATINAGDHNAETWRRVLGIFCTARKPNTNSYADFCTHFYNSSKYCFKILRQEIYAEQKNQAAAAAPKLFDGKTPTPQYQNAEALNEALAAQRAAIVNFGVAMINGDNSLAHFTDLCLNYVKIVDGKMLAKVTPQNANLADAIKNHRNNGTFEAYYKGRVSVRESQPPPPQYTAPQPTIKKPPPPSSEPVGEVAKKISDQLRAKFGTKPPTE